MSASNYASLEPLGFPDFRVDREGVVEELQGDGRTWAAVPPHHLATRALAVKVRKGKVKYDKPLAPLVLRAWGVPEPAGRKLARVAFKDGDADNCALANLEWVPAYDPKARRKA